MKGDRTRTKHRTGTRDERLTARLERVKAEKEPKAMSPAKIVIRP